MKHRRIKNGAFDNMNAGKELAPLSLCFVIGAAFTVALSGKIDLPAYEPLIWTSGGTFLQTLLSCSFGFLLVLLAATSLLYRGLIPAAVFIIGGFVSLQSASIISADNDNVAAKIIFAVIIPGLFLVPAFMSFAVEGLGFVKAVLVPVGTSFRRVGIPRILFAGILSVAATFAAAAYVYMLLPLII